MRQETVVNMALGLLCTCAVVVTSISVKNWFDARAARAPQEPTVVADWEKYAAAGHRMGPPDAPVVITEFSDFQCPFCRKMHEMLKTVETSHPGSVALVYRHYPLPMHPQAMPAAIAAECAGAQGKFAPMHDALFSQQDSLGKKSWEAYATTAGVPDLGAFTACLKSTSPEHAIARDTAAGNAIKIAGTPTLIINDLKIPAIGDVTELGRYINESLKKHPKRIAANVH